MELLSERLLEFKTMAISTLELCFLILLNVYIMVFVLLRLTILTINCRFDILITNEKSELDTVEVCFPGSPMAEGGVALEKEGKFLEDDAKFPCLICGEKGLTQNEMRVHIMMAHVERDISCPFCDLGGITSNEMNLHINSVHLAEENTSAQSSMSNTLTDSLDSSASLSQRTSEEETHSTLTNGDQAASSNAQKTNSQNSNRGTGQISLSDSGSSQTMKMAESSEAELNERVTSSQSSDGIPRGLSTEALDKTRLFLDVSQPQEEVGVLRMTRGFNSNHDNTAREAVTGRNPITPRLGFQGVQRNVPLAMPDINDNVEPDINSNIPGEFPCPMCQFSTISEADIQTHVNREHLDILSPCKGGDYEMVDDDSVPRCPLCGTAMASVDELQIHVNTRHSDILSPDQPMEMQEKLYPPMKTAGKNKKPIRAENSGVSGGRKNQEDDWEMAACSSSSWNGRWQDAFNCPVCDQEFDDAAILEIHVNGHFSADNTPGDHLNLL